MNEQKITDPLLDAAVFEAQKINKKFAVVAVSVFLSLIILPSLIWGALMLFAPRTVDRLDFDTGENRMKAEMPEKIDLSTVTADMEAYYNDRIPFRSVLYTFQNNFFLALEKPYTDHILPFLTDLLYGDDQGGPQLEELPGLDLDNLFGNETEGDESLPDMQIENEGDPSCSHTLKDTIRSQSTCSEFGQVERKCSKCGYTELHFVKKLDHQEVLISTTAPTCTSAGKQVFECSVCHEEIVKSVAKLSHNGTFIRSNAASYEDYGYSLYQCGVCGILYRTDITPKLIDTSYLAPQIRGTTSKGAIVGRSKWLFYTGNKSLSYYQGTNVLTNAEMAEYKAVMEQLQAVCDEKGIQLAFMCIPNKEIVYSEYMPTYSVTTLRRQDIFTDYLENNSNLTYVYPLEELKAYKPYFQTYRRYDTHWTYVGGFIGTQALYRALGLPTTDVRDVKVDVSMEVFGDLFGIAGISDKEKNSYPADYFYTVRYRPDVSYKQVLQVGTEDLFVTECEDAVFKKNLVLFGDSFRKAMKEPLFKDFQRCTVAYRDLLCSSSGTPVSSYNADMVREVKNADILVITSVERYDYNIVNQARELLKILTSD